MWCTVNVKSIIITMTDRWNEDRTSCAIIHQDVKMCDANMIQMNFIPSIIWQLQKTIDATDLRLDITPTGRRCLVLTLFTKGVAVDIRQVIHL